MMSFSEDAVFNLRRIDPREINPNVMGLLTQGEQIIEGYRTVRDQVVFTNKRIITIDAKGITGTRQEYFTLPYSRIQYFGVQTAGFAELIPDVELVLFFSNGRKAVFEFKGGCNILRIGQMISEYALAE